jgi:hypothetical protein
VAPVHTAVPSVTLVAGEVAASELTSGEELTLAHSGIDGTPCRWIMREFIPCTSLTVGIRHWPGPLDLRRWAWPIAPGQLVWACPWKER